MSGTFVRLRCLLCFSMYLYILHYVFLIYAKYCYYELIELGPGGPTKTHRSRNDNGARHGFPNPTRYLSDILSEFPIGFRVFSSDFGYFIGFTTIHNEIFIPF